MNVVRKVSRDIIDRRKQTLLGVVLGVLSTLFGVVLVGSMRHDAPDPDRDLLYVVSTALDRGQAFWETRVAGYRRAKVVVFENETASACGRALSASGPFFCDADERIYVDLRFLRALNGDLGRAIVIGHELGHHVQYITGLLAGR